MESTTVPGGGFVHLHVHTEYSLLDGMCRISGLMDRVKALGQTAVAITDHGAMYGTIEFYDAAKAAGIKPIIGCETYVAPRSRKSKSRDADRANYHLVLLCENETGYRNLCYMISEAFITGFYGKPRIDYDLLESHHEGLIALSACLGGEVPQKLLHDDYEGAKAAALRMSRIFGPDHYYLELQNHGIAEQASVNSALRRLARETGLPMVITNDAHYLEQKDAQLQDVLLCIQTQRTVDEKDRMQFETQEFYIKSESEMRSLFPGDEAAIANTRKIADMCNVEFIFQEYKEPRFETPEGYDAESYFEHLCMEGFARRYPEGGERETKQLQYEMQMIRKMGFVTYFLIVADYVGYARSRGIPVGPGRGSAAGSIVSYCMGITDVDPLQYNLYFERFLNPGRNSMPDIDIDFCVNRRQEVIDYVTQKYGAERVAQIVTFGTMKAKRVVRDVGKALGMSYAEADAVAKQVPDTLNITLEEALRVSPQLREMYERDERVALLIDTAKGLEGMPRNTSTHAAAVVISDEPVYHYVPLATNEDTVVIQYTMTTVERLGLLKMDFLGLRNLTVIEDAEQLIQRKNPGFRVRNVKTDDAETYAMISAGRTSGVFQMESSGMTGVCISLQPQSVEDLTAIVSLYRPGPMDQIPNFIANRHNPARISYLDPKLEGILSVTYGIIVYQEQVIDIFRQLGGYSLSQADNIRRAISKKKQSVIEAERKGFVYGDPENGIPGAVANGVSEEAANQIYDQILDFASYAFNKAHAVCYAIVAYETAYLKCHYPKEYMAALMTSVVDSKGKLAEYIAECRDLDIPVLPPDVNESEETFTTTEQGIRFGLGAVKNVSAAFVQGIMENRRHAGPYRDLTDFCKRVTELNPSKRMIENLIKCGALDGFGAHRSQMLRVYETVIDSIQADRKKNIAGQIDFFSLMDGESETTDSTVYPDIPEMGIREKLQMEKEVTGMYLSGHPMDDYRDRAKQLGAIRVIDLMEAFGEEGTGAYRDGQNVVIAGIVTGVKNKMTKNNTLMAYVTVEDDTGELELLCFERVIKEYGDAIQENMAVLVGGKISVREEKEPQIMADSVQALETAVHIPQYTGTHDRNGKIRKTDRQSQDRKPDAQTEQTLYLKLPGQSDPAFRRVKLVLQMFPGSTKTVLYMADTKIRFGTRCLLDDMLLEEMRSILGRDCVVLK